MSALVRSAKSGSDWTGNELVAYSITVDYQDAATFFKIDDLPQPDVNPDILTTSDPDDAAADSVYELLRIMNLAMAPVSAEESAVDDFVIVLLRALGYAKKRHTTTDVCVLDENEILLLLVQEDKRHMDTSDAEPRLIAEAIVAFAANNRTCRQTLGQRPLYSKIMAGITMKVTAPTFYKIEVTATLVTAVAGRAYPEAPTTVYAHIPDIPRPNRCWSEGMRPLDNRTVILSCYEAFKKFVN